MAAGRTGKKGGGRKAPARSHRNQGVVQVPAEPASVVPPTPAQAAAGAPVSEAQAQAIADAIMAKFQGAASPHKALNVKPGTVVEVRIAQGTYDEVPMERGRVFALKGARHDEQLMRLGYVMPFSGEPVKCGRCGATFSALRWLDGHGDRTHKPAQEEALKLDVSGLDPVERANAQHEFATSIAKADDAREERERERILRETPPYFEKTIASQTA